MNVVVGASSEPRDDRVESARVERVRPVGAQMFDGTLRRERRARPPDELLRVDGVRILRRRDDEEIARSDAAHEVIEVEARRERRDDERHVEARARGELPAVGARGATRARERDALVERRGEERHVPAVRVTREADARRAQRRERAHGERHVRDELRDQELAADEPVRARSQPRAEVV